MVSRVAEHLESHGVEFELFTHGETVEALVAEAESRGMTAAQILKVVVLDIRTGHALAVVPASQTVDVARIRTALNTRHVDLATREEIERDYPEFEPGGLPPIGSLVHTPVVVDPAVLEHEMVVFPAGTPRESIRARAADVFRDSNLVVAAITEESNDTAGVSG